MTVEGKALNLYGRFALYQIESNSEFQLPYLGSETIWDKLYSREGKSPDQQIRSLNYAKWKRKSKFINN